MIWHKYPKVRPKEDKRALCYLVMPIEDEELSYCCCTKFLMYHKQSVTTLSDGTIVKGTWTDANGTEDLTDMVKYWRIPSFPLRAKIYNFIHKFTKKRFQ